MKQTERRATLENQLWSDTVKETPVHFIPAFSDEDLEELMVYAV
jgi:hypothetical protein